MRLKKILMLGLVAVAGVFAAKADTYSRDVNTLPQAARLTLSNNFKAKVSVIKIDKDLGRVSDYEVVLTDGTEIQFDRDGNWKEIEMPVNKGVPEKFLPKEINNYIKDNHKGEKVVGLEKERSGFEVTLSNDLDLKFDRNGNFVRYD